MKKTIKIALVFCRYTLFTVGIWLIALNTVIQGGQRNQLYAFVNTEFSDSFSESKWQEITNGKSKGEVTKLLGEPLSSWEVKSKNSIYPANSYLAMDFSRGTDRKFMYARYASCTHTIVLDSSMNVLSKHIYWDED
jgi:hypothetical protein